MKKDFNNKKQMNRQVKLYHKKARLFKKKRSDNKTIKILRVIQNKTYELEIKKNILKWVDDKLKLI